MNNSDNSGVNELILLCREGNDDAFSELVGLYTPMLKRIILSVAPDEDDSFSEACIALYKAALTYDLAQRDVTFGLYSGICVRRRLYDLLRRRNVSVAEDFIDDVDVESIAVTDGIVSRLLHKEESESMRALAEELLSDYEYRVFKLWLSGRSASDIAELLLTDEKSVENAKSRILRKLRGAPRM